MCFERTNVPGTSVPLLRDSCDKVMVVLKLQDQGLPWRPKETVVLVTLHPSFFCHLAPPRGSPWSPQNSRAQACCPDLISFSDPCSVTMSGNKTGTGVKRWSTGLGTTPHHSQDFCTSVYKGSAFSVHPSNQEGSCIAGKDLHMGGPHSRLSSQFLHL